MPALHGGTWRDAYTRPGKQVTVLHSGGPADGVSITQEAASLPQARFYATSAARRRRRVVLARYVRHGAVELDVILFRYAGTDDRPGPVPGKTESPAWSW